MRAALGRCFAHRAIYREVIGNVEFQDFEGEGFALSKLPDFTRRCRIAAVQAAHRGQNLIILAASVSAISRPNPLLAPVMRTTCCGLRMR